MALTDHVASCEGRSRYKATGSFFKQNRRRSALSGSDLHLGHTARGVCHQSKDLPATSMRTPRKARAPVRIHPGQNVTCIKTSKKGLPGSGNELENMLEPPIP